MRCLKSLEDENAQLKRLLAKTMLDNAVLKDIPGESCRHAIRGEKRHFVQYATISRGACRLTSVDPETVRRERPPDNQDIREEMKQITAKRRQFGYAGLGCC